MQQFGKMFGGEGGQGKLMQSVIGMISGGGVSGLLSKFQNAGMEDKTRSWVSTDQPNQQLSAEEVRRGLGDQEVERLSQESGMPLDEVASNLGTMIPETVNELTPDGNVPDQSTVQQRIGSLAGKIPGLGG
jgi:uncharacterized protein YidB (DUF937 family)